MAPVPPSSSAAQPAVLVIGGGPAGLFAAERLARQGLAVAVLDAMPTVGRKFLMAGRGGLNLTHSEPLGDFIARYGRQADRFDRFLRSFSPTDLRDWADGLGAETFVGTSGRVFPKALKASPLLRAWLRRLEELGVEIRTRHRWLGVEANGTHRFAAPDGSRLALRPRAALLAPGGASWPRLGSDGEWAGHLAVHGIAPRPFRPANCGFRAPWSPVFADRAEGTPLKNLELRFAGQRVRGELVITRTGVEGGAVYALSAPLRDAIEREGEAVLVMDLRPQLSETDLRARLSRPRGALSTATWLRKALGNAPLYPLLRELAPAVLGDPARLATAIKALPLRLTGIAPIERAISTSGGLPFEACDERLMVKTLPGLFVAGEMLDWEAPTGGYLLQGCFSTAAWAADGILAHLAAAAPASGSVSG